MNQTQQIILFNRVMYNDNSYIATGYARALGITSFIVKGGIKKTPLRQALMQPLSLIDITLTHSTRNRLPYAKESKIRYNYKNLPFHPIKGSVALFIAEVLSHTLKESAPDHNLFDFIEQSLIFFDETTEKFGNFHLVFLCKLTRFMGFSPNSENYKENYWFDLSNGLFTPQPEQLSTNLHPSETKLFYQLLNVNYKNAETLKMSRNERNTLTEHLLSYYKLHIPEFGTIKSLEVLQQLFD